MNDELIGLLENARENIVRLRHENELLRARVEVMDIFAAALSLNRRMVSVSSEVDVVYLLSRAIEKIRSAPPASAKQKKEA